MAGVPADEGDLIGNPLPRDGEVLVEQLHPDRLTAQPVRDGERRAVAGERVEHEVAWPARVLDHGRGEGFSEVHVVCGAARSLRVQLGGAEEQIWPHDRPARVGGPSTSVTPRL